MNPESLIGGQTTQPSHPRTVPLSVGQGRQKRLGARHIRVIVDDLFRVPIQYQHDIYSPETVHQDLRHVDAPSLIRVGRSRHTPAWLPFRIELHVGLNQKVVLPHHLKHALLLVRKLLPEVQIRPDPTIPPERMISLERLDAGEQAFIALGDLEQPPPGQAGPPSAFFFYRCKTTP